MTDIESALSAVESSASAATLFGADPKTKYRSLALLIHPDTVPVSLQKRAAEAFLRMARMYGEITGRKAAASEKLIGKWIVGEPIAKGDLCDVYHARNSKDESIEGAFKLARSARDTDLLEREYTSLGILHLNHTTMANFQKYLPKVIDRIEASGRRANVLTLAPESHSLADIVALYPRGFDFRHVVWMMNRALNALGYAHTACGVIHGAITPQHLMYGPKSHSLTILDWCYSVTAESKGHVPAIVTEWKSIYPPEVSLRGVAHPTIDIYMLFACFRGVIPYIPKRFQGVFDWAMAASPRSRPSSAWELQSKWAAIAREEYGEPRYLELAIPVV